MVQIFVKSDSEISEWILIELQGDLESKMKSSLAGCFMGDLHYNLDGTPILIIGHHILHGKIVDMDKPIAVLIKEKEKCDQLDASQTESNETTEGSANAKTTQSTEYLVRAVIKKKLVFKTRPKPIVTNVAKKL